MSDEPSAKKRRAFKTSAVKQFWLLQSSYWLFLCFVSLFTLTLWYGQQEWSYISHTLLQAFIGLLLSLPLFLALMRTWNWSIPQRVTISIILVMFVAFLWTIARVSTFIIMTEEKNVWRDFGGWYFGSIFIFLCWTGLFYGIRYYQILQAEYLVMAKTEAEIKEEQLKRIQAQSIARDAQIKMLRYQLNPHFLCNTLNAINSLIELEESTKAQKMTVQLSKFLRYSLDNNPDNKISLEIELNALNLYLEIEKTRFAERLTLEFDISNEARQALVPSLLLQPIIENSMKHVIAQNENGGTINLTAKVENDRLLLALSDTGAGVKVEKTKVRSSKRRGIGLRNIDERLKVLYGNDYTIDLTTRPSGGLKTTITIPFETSEMEAKRAESKNHSGFNS
jgi:sensor histidine kinase YesM